MATHGVGTIKNGLRTFMNKNFFDGSESQKSSIKLPVSIGWIVELESIHREGNMSRFCSAYKKTCSSSGPPILRTHQSRNTLENFRDKRSWTLFQLSLCY